MSPCIMYHRTKGAKSVTSEDERIALGDGWHFDLSHCPPVDAYGDSSDETSGDSSVISHDSVTTAPEPRRRGRPPKVR